MSAILKRDFVSYFNSPIGYVFLAAYTLFTSVLFIEFNLSYLSSSITGVLGGSVSIFVVIIPLLAVKMLTEERKWKTDQILLTSPVSVTEIVLGKFFAALGVFLVALAITLIYVLILAAFGAPDYGVIFTSYLGVFLIGAAFISIALYLSSLTDNQFIGFILSFCVIGLSLLLGVAVSSNLFSNAWLNEILSWLAISYRFSGFSMGLIGLDAVVYYLSVCVLFIVLTVFSIEKRRWR